MAIDWELVAKVGGPIVGGFVGALIDRALEDRPKVVTYLGHTSAIVLRTGVPTPIQVHTHAIVVANAGRKPAQNVRLGHYVLPDFQVYPSVAYSVANLPSGGQEINFPSLVPKEQVTVSYLYFPPLIWNQINSYVKSDSGQARPELVRGGLPSHGWRARFGSRFRRRRDHGGYAWTLDSNPPTNRRARNRLASLCRR